MPWGRFVVSTAEMDQATISFLSTSGGGLVREEIRNLGDGVVVLLLFFLIIFSFCRRSASIAFRRGRVLMAWPLNQQFDVGRRSRAFSGLLCCFGTLRRQLNLFAGREGSLRSARPPKKKGARKIRCYSDAKQPLICVTRMLGQADRRWFCTKKKWQKSPWLAAGATFFQAPSHCIIFKRPSGAWIVRRQLMKSRR